MVTVALEMHVMREERARRQPALASLRPRQPPARGPLPQLGLPGHPWVLPWGCQGTPGCSHPSASEPRAVMVGG